MQTTTIKLTLKKKVDHWLKTLPEELRNKVAPNVIVTGGSIASMLLGEKVNDYDIYFRDINTVKYIADYYVNKFKEKEGQPKFKYGGDVGIYVVTEYQGNMIASSRADDKLPFEFETQKAPEDRVKIVIKSAGAASEDENATPTFDHDNGGYQYFEGVDPENGEQAEYIDKLVETVEKSNYTKNKGEYKPVFLSANAITLSDDVQLVIRFFGEPDQIHENYDFVHCTSYYDYGKNILVTPAKALEALLDRRLYYVGSKYPLCSMIRMRKFINRGWKISAGQILKCAMQLSELDLSDMATLEEQLTGVDAAYFHQLITALKEHASENGGNMNRVDQTYLGALIDRIV